MDEDQVSIENLIQEEDPSDFPFPLVNFCFSSISFELKLVLGDDLPFSFSRLRNYQATFFAYPLFIQFSQLKLGGFS
jgi:hypothetical protein